MAGNGSDWYALYTRSRHERRVESFLQQQRLGVYLPLKRAWSTRQDRKQVIEVPALPGYLFVNCTLYAEVRAEIKKAPGVVHLVEQDGKPARIPNQQIDALRIALAHSFNPQGHPFLKAGDRVRVIRGPMVGIEGFLLRVDEGQHRLVISVDYVNQSLSVEIDASVVEPVT
jgi:transcriptional antiterminator NusG